MSIGIGSSWDEYAEDDWDSPPIGAPIHDDTNYDVEGKKEVKKQLKELGENIEI